jgi:MarR family transcriptional regulator, lower aerobic nicotinate degradation pathway regulator
MTLSGGLISMITPFPEISNFLRFLKLRKIKNMDQKEVQTLARSIFDTGRTIHEMIIRIQVHCLAEACRKGSFNELSIAQLQAIKVIRCEKEVTISRVAELLEVSVPSASTMVDRLVEKGILIRERSHKDRRKVVVQVSPEAVGDINQVESAILKTFEDIVRSIGLDNSRQWVEVLERVKEVIEKK